MKFNLPGSYVAVACQAIRDFSAQVGMALFDRVYCPDFVLGVVVCHLYSMLDIGYLEPYFDFDNSILDYSFDSYYLEYKLSMDLE